MSRLRSAWLRNALFALVCVVAGGVLGLRTVYAQSAEFQALKEDLTFILDQPEVKAALLFTPFGSADANFDDKHGLSPAQIAELCEIDSTGGGCGRLGVNFGTHYRDGLADYKSARAVNMNWFLEIARGPNDPGKPNGDYQAVLDTMSENPDKTFFIRIGVAGNSIGFDNVDDYVRFLQRVAENSGGRQVIAIAGPNEPDIEEWFARECGKAPGTPTPESEEFYRCVAEPLKNYMEAVCNAELPDNIILTTPAFNMTSYTFPGIVNAMNEAGTDWSCVDAIAGNLYPAGKSMREFWTDDSTGAAIAALKSYGLSDIYITETGPINSLDDGSEGSSAVADDDFYIHPINGFVPQPNVDAIRDDLVKQGYEVQCAAPRFHITLEMNGQDAMKALLEDGNKPDGVVLGGLGPGISASEGRGEPVGDYIKSKMTVDFRDSLVPVFRDLEPPPQLKRSLEDYFSYRAEDPNSFNGTEIKSAAINSLLSRQQRCSQAVASLRARKMMCDKLASPSECSLYKDTIPNTSYTPDRLLSVYENMVATNYPGMSDFEACQDITGSSSREVLDMQEALLNTPLEISKSYRLAFLVTTIRLNFPVSSSMFSLFTHPRGGVLADYGAPVKPKTAVVVTAFKVPDITTNKGTIEGEGESGNTPFDDPAILTRNTLIPRALQKVFTDKGTDERVTLLEEARVQGQTPQDVNDSEIFCLEDNGEPGGTDGIGSCTDPLTKALVDIINAQKVIDKDSVECSSDTYLEKNDSLFDSGSLQPLDHPSRVFQANIGAALLKSLFSDTEYHNPGTGFDPNYGDTGDDNWNLKSVYHVTPKTEETGFPYSSESDDREVKHFLVYPTGYDQETVEMVLAGTFFSTEQLEVLQEEAEQKLLLQMRNAAGEFDGGSDSYSFTDNNDCVTTTQVDDDGLFYEERKCKEKSFGFGLSLNKIPENVGVLGARLGYWMYTVQKSLFQASSLPRKYLDACDTVEQFLLDRCGGGTADDQETYTEVAYCDGSDFVALRNISNNNLDRFEFFRGDNPDEELPATEFFPNGGDQSCSFNADVRILDGLTMILSDGKDLVGNNPGNDPCGGVTSVADALEIKRLPPEGELPDPEDGAWNDAPTMRTTGSSVSRASYNLKLKPGYYRVAIHRNQKNGVCVSNHTEVYNSNGEYIPGEQYVIDLTGGNCSRRSCVALNLQPNMEGGSEGEKEDDVGGCELSFEYEVEKYNNACGGGRAGDCEDEGGCGFWGDFIDDLNSGAKHVAGYNLYKEIFGRSITNNGDTMACTSDSGNNDPIFSNTIKAGDCSAIESESNPIDSISLFDKLVKFQITYWDGTDIEFPLPSRELWNHIQAASNRHGCDPLLVLATAQAMNRDYTNQSIPDTNGALGIFQTTPLMWEKWQVANLPGGRSNPTGKYGSCDFWQPTTFSRSGLDFSSPTNVREAVDVACRRILWSGAQADANNSSAFVSKLTSNPDNPETGSNREKFLPGDTYRAEYIHRLWQKLREETDSTAFSQPSNYPYGSCEGEPPSSTGPDSINYDIPTVLPATGVATYYSEGVMDRTLSTREYTLLEIPPAFIDTCEFDIPGTDYRQIFAELERRAANNGQSKVVGCAALLRYGDVPFRQTKKSEDIRMVWIKRPNGAPSSIPEVIGPIAIIDVAAKPDRGTIYDDHDGKWLIDLDYNTFYRLFAWKGGWSKPQDGLTICDTREQCQ